MNYIVSKVNSLISDFLVNNTEHSAIIFQEGTNQMSSSFYVVLKF